LIGWIALYPSRDLVEKDSALACLEFLLERQQRKVI
jgi:hypothetical protein